MSYTGENKPEFGEVFKAVKRIVEARGVRVAGEPLITIQRR